MTTKYSPLRALKGQADNIAKMVKAIERGETPIEDRGGKIAASLARGSFKFGVVMDDKIVMIEMAWATVRATSEVGLAEYILNQMREARDPVH